MLSAEFQNSQHPWEGVPVTEPPHGHRARLCFRGLWTMEAPQGSGCLPGPPGSCLSGVPRPLLCANRAEGTRPLRHGKPELPVLHERTSGSPPGQPEPCEESLVLGPFFPPPPLEMLPSGPQGILVCVLTPSLAAPQQVPELAPVLGGTHLIYIKKGGGSLSLNPK